MSEPYCREILTECGSSWHRMVNLVEIVRRVTTVIRLVSAQSSTTGDSTNFTKSIAKFANLLNIKEAFESCPSFENCPYAQVSLICESFVTFVGTSQLQAVTSETIARMMPQKLPVSKELLQIQEELEFLIESAASILSQAVITKKNKKQKFFAKQMDKGTAIQYLKNIFTSLETTRQRFTSLNQNHQMNLQLPNPAVLGITDKILKGIKLYLSSRKAQRGKKSLKKMLKLLSGTKSGASRGKKQSASSAKRSKVNHAGRLQVSGANRHFRSRGKHLPKWRIRSPVKASATWQLGNSANRNISSKQRHSHRKSRARANTTTDGPSPSKAAVSRAQQTATQSVRGRPTIPGKANSRAPVSPTVGISVSRPQPLRLIGPTAGAAHRKGRRLSSLFDVQQQNGCQYKQTMVARNCQLHLCLEPSCEP